MTNKYLEANRDAWDQRTLVHKNSKFYDIEAFKRGQCSLQNLELKEMGNVEDSTLLHLQCHFGQDTLSWGRLGAQATGIDFSPEAIKTAKELAEEIGGELKYSPRFFCADVLDALNVLPETDRESFDLVFTSYGTISWLPDLRPWARVISQFLKPGGFFYIAEFHPMLWVFDEDFKVPRYPYQNTLDCPSVFNNEGTYADPSAPLKTIEYSWNHALSTVIDVLLEEGLKIEFVHEHMSSPYNIFPRPVVVDRDPSLGQKGYQIAGLENRIPMIFSLKAKKV